MPCVFVRGIRSKLLLYSLSSFQREHLLFSKFNRYFTMTNLAEKSSAKSFGGWQKVYTHDSSEVNCKMTFGIYLPPQAEKEKCPVIYWLSGLTCTEQNVIGKGGTQRFASEYGIILVAPDTSPRGFNIEGEDDAYDFGSGAGFYLNATEEKWKNYRMYSYVTKELPAIINENFPAQPENASIFGHSMGGHGALICALKNPGKYKSVSAFAPICNPMQCPWGKKAFTGYLGPNQETWKEYDACELVKKYDGPPMDIYIDQGTADNFLTELQLLPENFVAACRENNVPVQLNMREGYDHSFFFITTYLHDHFKHHVKYLKN